MWPATPTPFPPGVPPIDTANLAASYSLWEFAPTALTMWNDLIGSTWTTAGQIAILIGLTIAFVALMIRWLQKIEVDL